MKIRFVKEIIHDTTHYFTERLNRDIWEYVPNSLSSDIKVARRYFEQIKNTGDITIRTILEEAHTQEADKLTGHPEFAWTDD